MNRVLTPFCLQYSRSVQQSSLFTTSDGHLGLGVIAEIEDVTTTRFTPASFAAVKTLIVPLIAGSRSSFYEHLKRKKIDFFKLNFLTLIWGKERRNAKPTSGSRTSSTIQGDARWKTPVQPLMAARIDG